LRTHCKNYYFGPVVRLHARIHSCAPRTRARRSAAKGFCSQGNTAIYLLYTHARISSILARATEQDFASFSVDDVVLSHEKEKSLALTILKLPDAVEALVQELLPSRLCDYTYSLCVTFNALYWSCKVIGTEEEKTRLILCHTTALSLR